MKDVAACAGRDGVAPAVVDEVDGDEGTGASVAAPPFAVAALARSADGSGVDAGARACAPTSAVVLDDGASAAEVGGSAASFSVSTKDATGADELASSGAVDDSCGDADTGAASASAGAASACCDEEDTGATMGATQPSERVTHTLTLMCPVDTLSSLSVSSCMRATSGVVHVSVLRSTAALPIKTSLVMMGLMIAVGLTWPRRPWLFSCS